MFHGWRGQRLGAGAGAGGAVARAPVVGDTDVGLVACPGGRAGRQEFRGDGHAHGEASMGLSKGRAPRPA